MKSVIRVIDHYWWQLTVVILIAISVLSLTPFEHLPPAPGSDKTHHFVAYAAVAFPLMLRLPRYWYCYLLGLAGWSGIIELIQPYVNRYGEWLDLAANVAGLVIGSLLALAIRYYRRNEVKTGSQ